MSTAEGRPTRDTTAGMPEIIKSQQMHQQGHQQHSIDTNISLGGFLRNMREKASEWQKSCEASEWQKVVKKGTKKGKNSPDRFQSVQ